jgi:hypothetical protein
MRALTISPIEITPDQPHIGNNRHMAEAPGRHLAHQIMA